jgi:hypothetical protein
MSVELGAKHRNNSSQNGFRNTAGSASSQLKFMQVEKAKEFESYRQLPKYNKPVLACINPSPKKKRTPPREVSPSIIVSGSTSKLQIKKVEKKQIPDHLMRAPMDSFTSSPSSKKFGRPKSSVGGKGKKLNGSRGKDGENKRAKRAEANRKVFFSEIKKLIDNAEDATNAPGGNPDTINVIGGGGNSQNRASLSDVRIALRDRRLIRFLFASATGNRSI